MRRNGLSLSRRYISAMLLHVVPMPVAIEMRSCTGRRRLRPLPQR